MPPLLRLASSCAAPQALALASLAILLLQQPFVIRPRISGQNALKVVPVKLAICGLVNAAAESPTVMRNPTLASLINQTSQVLLAPHECVAIPRHRYERVVWDVVHGMDG